MRFLPLGTVVILKNAEKKLMIEGYLFANENDPSVTYDYCDVMYPEGRMNSTDFLLFKEDMIDHVIALGYADEEQRLFMERLEEAMKTE